MYYLNALLDNNLNQTIIAYNVLIKKGANK